MYRTTAPPKSRLFSIVIPGRPETYKFVTKAQQSPEEILDAEREYFDDMGRSLFSITYSKAGWDCLRHLEILAAGALPIFTDIEKAPAGGVSAYPVNVFATLKKWPGLIIKGVKGMPEASKPDGLELELTEPLNKTMYMLANQAMISLSHRLLTTRAMAQHIISIVGISAANRILYITGHGRNVDYLGDSVLHGFLSLMRKNVVDAPKIAHLFHTEETFNETEFAQRKVGLYGYGFGGMVFNTYEAPGSINRENIRQRIRDREFDYVIFGWGHRWESWEFFDDVCAHYPKDKVVAVFGGDGAPGLDPGDSAIDRLAILAACSQYLFSREMDPLCVDAPKA